MTARRFRYPADKQRRSGDEVHQATHPYRGGCKVHHIVDERKSSYSYGCGRMARHANRKQYAERCDERKPEDDGNQSVLARRAAEAHDER